MPISGLANGDPRAAERTFQLLSQVTGRAGRTGLKSHGLLQTYQPQHPVMQAIVSGDAGAFYEREIAERERAILPPFGRLASIIVSAETRNDAEAHARGIRNAAPSGDRHFRARAGGSAAGAGARPPSLPAAGARAEELRHAGLPEGMLSQSPKERGSIHVQLDIDPQSFL
jgi:primosomal protein N' (replication factor Y)